MYIHAQVSTQLHSLVVTNTINTISVVTYKCICNFSQFSNLTSQYSVYNLLYHTCKFILLAHPRAHIRLCMHDCGCQIIVLAQLAQVPLPLSGATEPFVHDMLKNSVTCTC